MNRSPLRLLWICMGFLCLGLGTLGVILPVLPTVPFYMATVFFFGKSSRRLRDWFVATRLYKKHLESYVKERAMTAGTKLRIISMVSLMMLLSFYFMKNVPLGRICLVVVWIWHLWYFLYRIKTVKENIAPETTVE